MLCPNSKGVGLFRGGQAVMCPNSGMITMEGHIAHVLIVGNILLHVTPVIYNAVLFYWYV